jgi:hypothetical protein
MGRRRRGNVELTLTLKPWWVKTLTGVSRIEKYEQRRPNLPRVAVSPCPRVQPSRIARRYWDLRVNLAIVPAPPHSIRDQIWGELAQW